MSRPWTTSGSLLGGVAAAIGASACCAGPLLLVVLGVGGAWGSRLVALEVYQPYFVAAALAFFGYAFFKLYRRPEDCAPGEVCAIPVVRWRQRVIFWVVAAAAGALMAFPLYATLFY
ncbi:MULTISPECIES: mercuric transporter MerT family protein [Sphaerotilaceae]|uniref:mercuric transporter MerT family protein n=1 Tax=Sphaerotilaceae TaxID=2975441 RepID=UPI0006F9EA78|nr:MULTISPECIES: mercuric transporter MerT family protein [Sphaerotilaceae]KQW67783.1 mercury transporter MerT [Methylibium sp. Root1272]MBX9715636.1 mercury transporter MerT [Burkholderiaceae bacterium]MCR5864571.1 mercury transporter MerT [Aquincola sp. J276]